MPDLHAVMSVVRLTEIDPRDAEITAKNHAIADWRETSARFHAALLDIRRIAESINREASTAGYDFGNSTIRRWAQDIITVVQLAEEPPEPSGSTGEVP